jgi:hypothetical protein
MVNKPIKELCYEHKISYGERNTIPNFHKERTISKQTNQTLLGCMTSFTSEVGSQMTSEVEGISGKILMHYKPT